MAGAVGLLHFPDHPIRLRHTFLPASDSHLGHTLLTAATSLHRFLNLTTTFYYLVVSNAVIFSNILISRLRPSAMHYRHHSEGEESDSDSNPRTSYKYFSGDQSTAIELSVSDLEDNVSRASSCISSKPYIDSDSKDSSLNTEPQLLSTPCRYHGDDESPAIKLPSSQAEGLKSEQDKLRYSRRRPSSCESPPHKKQAQYGSFILSTDPL